jgi:hypothetical protein
MKENYLELTLHRLLLKGRSGIEPYSRLERDTDSFSPEKTRTVLDEVKQFYTRFDSDYVMEAVQLLEGKPTAPRAVSTNNISGQSFK